MPRGGGRDKNEENDRSDENDKHDEKIAVFMPKTRMWITDEGHDFFAAKTGQPKGGFLGSKSGFLGGQKWLFGGRPMAFLPNKH